ncbi:hypothetical protein E4U42_003917 [Claviceps africana]|uniref:Uncharacterized protein n=1 Tax=Claviceps africana TaxID=83212 RepID=A0A8K0J732_9HYPO|nr:hypothetical protein E4U42_003917 [Claviceps africana]
MFITWANTILASLAKDHSSTLAARVAVAVFPLVSVLALLGLVGKAKRYDNAKSPYPVADAGLGSGGLFGSLRQRQQWFDNGSRIIHDAYKRFPDTIFTLPSPDYTIIVLPARFLDEVKNIPRSVGNLSHFISQWLMGTWTTADYAMIDASVREAITKQYIGRIGQVIEPTAQETDHAVSGYLGDFKDYTPILVQSKMAEIASQIMCRTLVGPDLCRNPEFLASASDCSIHLMMGAIVMKRVPEFARPLFAVLTPFLYRIRSCRRTMKRLLRPLIQQSLEWRRSRPESWEAHVKTDEMNSLEWLVEVSSPEDLTVDTIFHRFTAISFAALHATAGTISNALLDLASDFDRWAPDLRREVATVLGSRSTKEITNADLSKMWLLDSFLKESQRFNQPGSMLTVNRKMNQQHTLSTGDVIPKNTTVCFAGASMSLSEEYFHNPHEFDGFRFARLREAAAHDTTGQKQQGLQFTSSHAGSLHFGHGRYACPGRFLGSLVSKLVMIDLLQRYDMELGGSGRRPDNIFVLDIGAVDPKAELLLRDRVV